MKLVVFAILSCCLYIHSAIAQTYLNSSFDASYISNNKEISAIAFFQEAPASDSIILQISYQYFSEIDSFVQIQNQSFFVSIKESKVYYADRQKTTKAKLLGEFSNLSFNLTDTSIVLYKPSELSKIIFIKNRASSAEEDSEEVIQIAEEDDFLIDSIDEDGCDFCFTEPEFPGGDSALFKFLSDHAIFTDEMRETGINGSVYVQFTVLNDGTITDIIILKGLHEIFDQEAIRIVNAMPLWYPAANGCGINVRARYSLVIKFREKV